MTRLRDASALAARPVRTERGFEERTVLAVRFVPMIGEAQKRE